jgi:hypothetical protein
MMIPDFASSVSPASDRCDFHINNLTPQEIRPFYQPTVARFGYLCLLHQLLDTSYDTTGTTPQRKFNGANGRESDSAHLKSS